MARKSFVVMVAGTMILFLCSVSSAVVPDKINYQGKLTTAQGGCLNDTVSMTFTIYADDQGTVVDWTEDQDSVKVKEGIFNVLLGSETPIPASVFDGSTKYLGVQVESDPEMRPLKPMVSVAYAYKSLEADTADYARAGVGGGDNDWIFLITDGADTTLMTGGEWGIARYGNTLYGNRDSTHVNLGVACTTGASGQNWEYCTVGGGIGNTASEDYATVGGGRSNTAGGGDATVGGGYSNVASGAYATVGGGWMNAAIGSLATVGGGYNNIIDRTYATVGGGWQNTAGGYCATVGGGHFNHADTNYATVAGGEANTASGYLATVGGGLFNVASGHVATVGGGERDTASGQNATVGGGKQNTASGDQAAVGGGYLNAASGRNATVGGGHSDTASGLYATVGGGHRNTASEDYATVGGGAINTAKANYATVGGGQADTASGWWATVGGGYHNTAKANYATVGGGGDNNASGYYATVPGGYADTAAGDYSLAAGDSVRISSAADYTFAFGRDFTTSTPNAVIFHNSSDEIKVGIGLTNPGNILTVQQGSTTDPIADAWTVHSSREYKKDIHELTPQEYRQALDEIVSLPVVKFRYKAEDSKEKIGLIAEEAPEQILAEGNNKAISLNEYISLLHAALKAQQEQIDALKAVVNELTKE